MDEKLRDELKDVVLRILGEHSSGLSLKKIIHKLKSAQKSVPSKDVTFLLYYLEKEGLVFQKVRGNVWVSNRRGEQ